MNTPEEIVGRHKAVFSKPPSRTPSDKQADGPLLGNGDVGVVLSGSPEQLSFLVSKNDFWKTQPGFPNGGPRPIGGFDLMAPELVGASYRVEVDVFRAELTGTFEHDGVNLELRAWVAASSNELVVEVGGNAQVASKLWVHQGDDSVSETRADGAVVRRYSDAVLAWPSQAGLALATGEGRYLVTVASSFEEAALEFPGPSDPEQLRRDHRRWWTEFWSESLIDISGDEIERHYYGAQYLLACCCRNREFPPGLWGNWITTDQPAWAGDYHLNYNYQAPFWGLYSSNHLQLADCYDAPLLDYIETARRSASELLGVRGIYCDVGIGPRGFCASLCDPAETDAETLRAAADDQGRQFWGQKSNAVFAAVPMLLRWEYSRDPGYAAKVYPYLIEVANFWEDYLRFEEGRYVIYNDAFREAGPWEGPGWEKLREDFNPIISLGLLHMFFEVMPAISAAIARDSDRIAKWRHIRQHLSELTLEGNLLRAAEKGPSSQCTEVTRLTLHGTIWPCTWVGEKATPRYFEVLREAVSRWDEKEWRGGNSFDTVPPGAARLRIDPAHILEMIRRKIEAEALPNLWIEQSGGGIETCGGITAGLNEMLLQSHEGIIRIFPCWPRSRDAAFENLRAMGAFLVSARQTGGTVCDVKIRSEKGGFCVVENPWPGAKVRLKRSESATACAGDTLDFPTTAGEDIHLEPQDSAADSIRERDRQPAAAP